MQSLAMFDFIVLCGASESSGTLDLCLERLNTLEQKMYNVDRVRVFLVPVGEDAMFIKKPKFAESLAKFKNIIVSVFKGNSKHATEARAYNYGLSMSLQGPSTYTVFLHDSDIVIDKDLLSYYRWLYDSAHNPSLIGAVTFITNKTRGEPSTLVKMCYSDEVLTRGTCYNTAALVSIGPFDEMFTHHFHQNDLSSRLTHHGYWLVRVGKEPQTYIQFGKQFLTADHEKLSFVNKQNKVWFIYKWYNKGVWEAPDNSRVSCVLKKDTFADAQAFTSFLSLFKSTPTALRERAKECISDVAIAKGIEVSPVFVKKPLGAFRISAITDFGPFIGVDNGVTSHMHCELTTNELLWKPRKVLQ